jgi:hypothetical protein
MKRLRTIFGHGQAINQLGARAALFPKHLHHDDGPGHADAHERENGQWQEQAHVEQNDEHQYIGVQYGSCVATLEMAEMQKKMPS